MKRRSTLRDDRIKQINQLYAKTRQRQVRVNFSKWAGWGSLLLLTLVGVGLLTHLVMSEILDKALYKNPKYALKKIVIETKGDFSQRQIRQSAGISIGENVWSLDMAQIQKNIERLPFVAEARVEKHLPDKLVIKISERTPIFKVTGGSSELGREVFYLDRDACILFKPRPGETLRPLPEIIGLRNRDIEAGQKLDRPEIVAAVNLLKQMELTPLYTTLNIRTIDVSKPVCLKATTAEGSVIYFRYGYVAGQLHRLQEILNIANQREQQISTIDLTLDRNVPVVFAQKTISTTATVVSGE